MVQVYGVLLWATGQCFVNNGRTLEPWARKVTECSWHGELLWDLGRKPEGSAGRGLACEVSGGTKTLSGSFDILIKNCGSGQLGLKTLAMTDMSPARLEQTLCFPATTECWLA